MIHPIVDNSEYTERGDVERRIRQCRELMNPSPVRTGHIPQWFATRLRRAFGARFGGAYRGRSAGSALYVAERALGNFGWLDHCGSTAINGVRCFVGEPYGFSPEDAKQLTALCDATGLRWWLSANSWHYPGYTVRVVIHEPKDEG